MKEHNYLSISLFILVIFLLLIGGNFLIKNKYNSLKDKSHQEIRRDTSKDYIYYTDDNIISYALDLSYPTIHLNINNEEAISLEDNLNKRMIKAKESIVKLSDVSINKDDIVYEIGSEDIYEADFLKYNTLNGDDYLTLEVSYGHLNITKEEGATYLEYYTFSKDTGFLLSDEEIKKIGSITDDDIAKSKEKYESANEVTIEKYQLYLDKYANVKMNVLVNNGHITYNDTVNI